MFWKKKKCKHHWHYLTKGTIDIGGISPDPRPACWIFCSECEKEELVFREEWERIEKSQEIMAAKRGEKLKKTKAPDILLKAVPGGKVMTICVGCDNVTHTYSGKCTRCGSLKQYDSIFRMAKERREKLATYLQEFNDRERG